MVELLIFLLVIYLLYKVLTSAYFWLGLTILLVIVYLYKRAKKKKANNNQTSVINDNNYQKINKSYDGTNHYFDNYFSNTVSNNNDYENKVKVQTLSKPAPTRQQNDGVGPLYVSNDYNVTLPSAEILEKSSHPTREQISNVKKQGEFLADFFNKNDIICDFSGGSISESFVSIKLLLKKKKDLNSYFDVLNKLKQVEGYENIFANALNEADDNTLYLLIGKRSDLKLGTLVEKDTNDNALSYPVGEDFEGNAIFGNLKANGNLLISGRKLIGKSSLAQSILVSLLMKNSPNELKLVIADSGKLNYMYFRGIKHLLYPVLNIDSDNMLIYLRKLIVIGNERIRILNNTGFKSIEDYNKNTDKKVCSIILLIDEIDDYKLKYKKDFEDYLSKLISIGPRLGIYCIGLTDDVNKSVLSDNLRASFSGRISFEMNNTSQLRIAMNVEKVENQIEEDEILYKENIYADCKKLIPPYISDLDMKNVCEHYKDNVEIKTVKNLEQSSNKDELYDEAVEYVKEMQRASTSLLQRKFNIGYNRAERLIGELEKNGIVSPGDDASPRKVLIK